MQFNNTVKSLGHIKSSSKSEVYNPKVPTLKKIKKNTNKCLNDASQEFGKAHRNQEQWRARNNKSQPPQKN